MQPSILPDASGFGAAAKAAEPAPSHLPSRPGLNIARAEYVPYPAYAVDEDVRRLLQEISMRAVTAVHWNCAPGWQMEERRVGDDMFFYVVRGRGQASVDGRTHRLEPGTCVHVRRGLLQSAAGDTRDPLDVIILHYTATIWGALTVAEILDFPTVFQLPVGSPPALLMEEACREYALRPAGWQRGVEALLLRLILLLVREHEAYHDKRFAPQKLSDLQRLLPALEVMRHSLHAPVAVAALAHRCGFSEAQFRRVFKRAVGATPVQSLRRLRMEQACALLRETDETVATIARRVGYAEPAFFAHSFRSLMGLAPGRYRTMALQTLPSTAIKSRRLEEADD